MPWRQTLTWCFGASSQCFPVSRPIGDSSVGSSTSGAWGSALPSLAMIERCLPKPTLMRRDKHGPRHEAPAFNNGGTAPASAVRADVSTDALHGVLFD